MTDRLGRVVENDIMGWAWAIDVCRTGGIDDLTAYFSRDEAEEMHRRLTAALHPPRPVNADAIAAAEAEVRAGASVSSVRRKYRLSGSVVQRLGKIRKGL